jgi:DNA-binding MarR family transcriptional regulator
MAPEDKQEVLFRREHHDVREKIDTFLEQIREELDDHRAALNENTNEIESNYELLNQLNARMDKISERLDELTMLVKHGSPPSTQEFKIEPLTGQEKETFFALYTLTETTPAVTYHQLARKLTTTVEAVSRTITSMIGKGVPVEKKYSNGNAFLGLDKHFREAQAKQNLVRLDTKLTYWDSKKF